MKLIDILLVLDDDKSRSGRNTTKIYLNFDGKDKQGGRFRIPAIFGPYTDASFWKQLRLAGFFIIIWKLRAVLLIWWRAISSWMIPCRVRSNINRGERPPTVIP